MLFGWVVAGLGLLFVIFPRPLVAAARGWRIGMRSLSEARALRAARVGAVVALALGVIFALA